MLKVVLRPKREHSVLRGHPWIFSGAVAQEPGADVAAGSTVEVRAADGALLGYGAWSPASQIRVRMWVFGEGTAEINAAWFRERVFRAVGARAAFFAQGATSGFRLINAESDGLPGVTVDWFDGVAVCQLTSAGAEFWRDAIVAALLECVPCSCVYERSDADARRREGLEARCGVLSGALPDEIVIGEYGCRFGVDVREGHKTGFYLDQRESRRIVAGYAPGCEVLNTFCYTGGFGIAALAGGATQVTQVDVSAAAIERARANTLLNHCSLENSEFIVGDVFDVLRRFRDSRRQFDLIVLDPPKFADSKGALMKAARGYKDINVLGMKLLRAGGVLATFSCSGAVSAEFFRTIVAEAAADAKREVQILERLQQPADHPELVSFPEGNYLKGLLCRVF